ncbi:MAG: NAD(P)/FAD-dependent oxidoreductase [Pseudoruegeria sp.]
MKTLIIGGGLSGLAIAEALQSKGQDYLLLEARDRFGGRIKTERHSGGDFDLGPAWFWPGQPRILSAIDRFNLETFDQYFEGALSTEDENGRIQRGIGFASMQGSWRLKGGFSTLTDVLANRLPPDRKRLNAAVKVLSKTKNGVLVELASGDIISADRVVLALPPRVALKIRFAPDLSKRTLQDMMGIATWMAGQAKAVAVYRSPFWREAGLSGDASSRYGPMVEIHDASLADSRSAALFGFIGVPPEHRSDQDELKRHIIVQLTRLFGPEAADPVQLYVKDWADDPLTSTPADHRPLYTHPSYGLTQSMIGLWNDKLFFAGTEVAPQFGGYLEGALEAAENVLKAL